MKDFLLDENYDLATSNGDFVCGNSDQQNQVLLLTSLPGDWKESPNIGVDVESYINTEDISGLLTQVKKQFENDGMTVIGLPKIENGKIKVNAEYK